MEFVQSHFLRTLWESHLPVDFLRALDRDKPQAARLAARVQRTRLLIAAE